MLFRTSLQIQILATLLAITVLLVSGCGRGPKPSSTAAAIGTRPGWNVILAEPSADTLPVPWREVIPAVKRTFKAEHWRVERKDPWDGTLVTRWKPIQHALVKVFAGKIEARCAVSVQPLESSRTLVTFQAGIASRKSLTHSPALGLAKRSSQKASRKWLEKLRADLHRHGALEAAKP
jgi:hypothetical protein